MADTTLVIKAERVFTGLETTAFQDGIVVVRDGKIAAVGSAHEVGVPQGAGVRVIEYPDATLLPGLVDVHCHLVLPGDGRTAEEMVAYDDNVLTLQAAQNARRSLQNGVTTLADMGARNRVTFSLRTAIQMGLTPGPRLILCGRPLTITGGHLWFFNEEVDGVEPVRHSVRQLLKEGADVIKVLTTGGGTIGTDPTRPTYRLEELQAITEEAHSAGKKTAAHCSSIVGMERALDAGFDLIFHGHFYEPGGTLSFQPKLAQRLADAPIYMNPTLQVNHVRITGLEAKGDSISAEEEQMLAMRQERYAGQLENVGKLVEMGVKMTAGSDAGWGSYGFGDFVAELEQLVRVGMTPGETLLAATRNGALALGVEQTVGTLEPGKLADLVVVAGDPTQEIGALRDLRAIFLGGKAVDLDS